MSARDLAKRLALAEAVCLMYGWSPVHDETARDKATLQLWCRWIGAVPKSFTDPENHPELNDEFVERLAAQRDATRQATFTKIREFHVPAPLVGQKGGRS